MLTTTGTGHMRDAITCIFGITQSNELEEFRYRDAESPLQ